MIDKPAFREYVETVRDVTDIVNVVGARLQLDRFHKACCPFHEDDTPSFSVNPKGRYFHCFGCGVAGDVFRFVELFDGLSFFEAVKCLAVEAGLPPWQTTSASDRDHVLVRPPRIPPPMPKDAPTRPSRAEVESVWNMAGPVTVDAEAMGWFCHRHQRHHAYELAERTEMWDLARAVRPGVELPLWARCRGVSWTKSGHRLIFRLFDHTGTAVSLRARCLDLAGGPKSLAPAGTSVKGLIFADPLGVQILAGTVPDWWQPSRIVISEGEPDWLSWAARQSDAHEDGPAYFGVVAGGWSKELADRLPDGTAVSIRTHHDEAGEKYAGQIVETLGDRCRPYRSRPDGGVAS